MGQLWDYLIAIIVSLVWIGFEIEIVIKMNLTLT